MFGILVRVPVCTGNEPPRKLLITLQDGPRVASDGCLPKGGAQTKGWKRILLKTDDWNSRPYFVEDGAVVAFWPRLSRAGVTTFRWSVRFAGSTIARGLLLVRTVVKPSRPIYKDTDMDEFQNVCVNERRTILSRDGGRLYCLTERVVTYKLLTR